MHSGVASAERAAAQIDARTRMGAVRLVSADLDGSRRFYERAIGLRGSEQDDGTVALGIAGSAPLVELVADAGASCLDRQAPACFTSRSSSLRGSSWRVPSSGWGRPAGTSMAPRTIS